MPVMDEFKKEREALKNAPLKQKLSYFMDYYKWHVIASVAALVIVVSIVMEIVNQKDCVLYICLLNTGEFNDTTEYMQSLAEYAGIDLNKESINFDTSLFIEQGQLDQNSVLSTQKFVTYLAAGELDTMITDLDSMADYANDEYFYDMREFLTPEQIENYEQYFYYVDMAVVQKKLEARSNLNQEFIPDYPDPRHPENMEQPVPVGLYLEGENALKSLFTFRSDEVIIGVFGNTKHGENVSRLIDFLMQ